jgi:hypothetical protein
MSAEPAKAIAEPSARVSRVVPVFRVEEVMVNPFTRGSVKA